MPACQIEPPFPGQLIHTEVLCLLHLFGPTLHLHKGFRLYCVLLKVQQLVKALLLCPMLVLRKGLLDCLLLLPPLPLVLLKLKPTLMLRLTLMLALLLKLTLTWMLRLRLWLLLRLMLMLMPTLVLPQLRGARLGVVLWAKLCVLGARLWAVSLLAWQVTWSTVCRCVPGVTLCVLCLCVLGLHLHQVFPL
jgi:hypothetical protein